MVLWPLIAIGIGWDEELGIFKYDTIGSHSLWTLSWFFDS